ncbi:hypothetical protein TWF694_010711 [Orbilia ellipsospora]|uniref:ABC transporter domain-containing protein n=1 Tax=Orbilia ellipsospora TaxID=2528407 RepID=A0AAV9X830_9PEZI
MTTTIHMKEPANGTLMDQDDIPALTNEIFTSSTSQGCLDAANKLFALLVAQPYSFRSLARFNILPILAAAAADKKDGTKRESAMIAYSSLYSIFIPEARCTESLLLDTLEVCLDGLADKGAVVKESAQYSVDTMFSLLPIEALVSALLPILMEYLKRPASKWQGKIGALQLVAKLAKKSVGRDEEARISFEIIASKLEELIPVVESGMHDLKAEVSKQAIKTMQTICGLIDNDDIKRHIPLLIDNMSKPSDKLLQKAIHDLSHTTFIHPVTSPSLALVTPLLHRVLSNPTTSQEMLRQTVVIIENLTKLVHNPIEARTFLPQLLPGVQRVRDHASLPEVRVLGDSTLKVVEKAMRGEGGREGFVDYRVSVEQVKKVIVDQVGTGWVDKNANDAGFWERHVRDYVVAMVREIINIREPRRVGALVEPYLVDLKGASQAQSIAETLQNHFVKEDQKWESRAPTPEDDAHEIEIVNTPFSLAYGGMLLLSHTNLRLLKGHRYGLCGRNGAGKSTLMRSIAEGKLEGFPSKDEVRTCFVEHKLQGEEAKLSIIEFIEQDPEISTEGGKAERRKRVKEALEAVGFDEYRQAQPVGALSGGWKMKVELARAMLLRADILLLDEPTNHLDVSNVRWLMDYLKEHTEITSMIVSHDSAFLDEVCTDILHYESKKLVHYRGNLAAFVKKRPEEKSYYSLDSSVVQFKFPNPGILSGVKSMTRSIMKMTNVTFTYPGASKPSMVNVSVQLSLSSRVAILGPNGAGKSTLIKLLTGELVPQTGLVSKHPNIRVAYVPQHSLEYVNMHLEKTPLDYIRWRFQNGDDRETNMKATRIVSDEERKLMDTPIDIGDGKGPKKIEKLIGRQKFKKSFMYEVKWQNLLPKHNTMITRETLIKHGFSKMVQEFDDKESAREGLGFRELTITALKQHFEDVALPEDIAAHNEIAGLSGGQRVKVVLAAAMWNNPHIVVLDEPTNYLDRESMGALSHAIKDFKGGVVIISHNSEFLKGLLNEEWVVDAGNVATKGGVYDNELELPGGSRPGSGPASRVASRAGSVVNSAANSGVEDNAEPSASLGFKAKKPKKKKLTRNEVKEREARRRLRHLEWLSSPKGTPKPVDTDDEA